MLNNVVSLCSIFSLKEVVVSAGNSGGPLLDSSGRLIGMNTAIYSPSGASAGIGVSSAVHVFRSLLFGEMAS